MAIGTAILNFGAAPGNQDASVAVAGQTGLVAATSAVEAWLMADTTADHGPDEHIVAASVMKTRAGSLVDGTGFTIFGHADTRLTGQFTVHWVWV